MAYNIRIAYIGGGSRYWAQELMADPALSGELVGELVLHDINHDAALRNVAIGEAVFGHADANGRFAVRAEADLHKALEGADFVVCSIEPGPVDMRYADLEIPKSFGILQSVGDTTGPGGIIRAMRAMPMMADFAKAVMAVCPEAWVINYTNPMAWCTAALYAVEPNIKAFGCCHEVFGTQRRVGNLVQAWFGLDERPPRHEIKLDIAGVNHFTLSSGVRWNGQDMMPRIREMIADPEFFASKADIAAERKAKGSYFGSCGMICYDFLRRFDVLGSAGDRHLAEFVPWYLTSEDQIERWGVTLTPFSWRKQNAERPGKTPDEVADKPLKRSGEEGVAQMLALLGHQPLDTNVNLPNRGQMAGYPNGAIVETYAQFRLNRISPLLAAPLPTAIDGHMHRIVDLQRTLTEAFKAGSRHQALQAMLLDPLTNLPNEKAVEMFEQMCDHCEAYVKSWN